jgi:hypothetical protein
MPRDRGASSSLSTTVVFGLHAHRQDLEGHALAMCALSEAKDDVPLPGLASFPDQVGLVGRAGGPANNFKVARLQLGHVQPGQLLGDGTACLGGNRRSGPRAWTGRLDTLLGLHRFGDLANQKRLVGAAGLLACNLGELCL